MLYEIIFNDILPVRYCSVIISHNRHFQLNPILILEFDIGVRIFLSRDILKNNM